MTMRVRAVVAWVALALAWGMFFISGCHKKNNDERNAGRAGVNPPGAGEDSTAITGAGDGPAASAMREELGRRGLKTADGWVSETPTHVLIASGERADSASYHRQIKALKFDVESEGLCESDQLNGVTFRGECHFSHAPERMYGDPNAFGPPRWSDWNASHESVRREQRRGKWTFGGMGYMVKGTKPAAATVASLK